MISRFFAILLSGHFALILTVIATQVQIYKEVITIASIPAKDRELPLFKTLSWYFLLSTNYFLYGESLIHYFKQRLMVDALFTTLATHHRFISFGLYLIVNSCF